MTQKMLVEDRIVSFQNEFCRDQTGTDGEPRGRGWRKQHHDQRGEGPISSPTWSTLAKSTPTPTLSSSSWTGTRSARKRSPVRPTTRPSSMPPEAGSGPSRRDGRRGWPRPSWAGTRWQPSPGCTASWTTPGGGVLTSRPLGKIRVAAPDRGRSARFMSRRAWGRFPGNSPALSTLGRGVRPRVE